MEPDDPPPKAYGFKERAFNRDNAPASASPPVPTAKELAILAGPAVYQPGQSAAGSAKAGDPNDVYVTLQQNRAREKELGGDEIEIRQVRSRRRRDYWLILLTSEALLGTITLLGRSNPMTFVSGLAGMVLVGVSVT